MNQKLALSHFICGPPPITWRPSLMGIIFRVAVGAGWHVIADRNWKMRHTSQDIVRLQAPALEKCATFALCIDKYFSRIILS